MIHHRIWSGSFIVTLFLLLHLIKVALFACGITFGTDDVSGWKMFWNIQPDLQIKGCWSRFINDVCFLMFSTRIGTTPCLGMARDGSNNFEVHAVRWEKKWDRNYWWQPWLMMWIAFKTFMKNMRSFYTKKVIVWQKRFRAMTSQFHWLFNELQLNIFTKCPTFGPRGDQIAPYTTCPLDPGLLTLRVQYVCLSARRPRNAAKKDNIPSCFFLSPAL